MEKTVSWRDEDLNLVSRSSVMILQGTDFSTAFGFFGEGCYLHAKLLTLRCPSAAVTCVCLYQAVEGERCREQKGEGLRVVPI